MRRTARSARVATAPAPTLPSWETPTRRPTRPSCLAWAGVIRPGLSFGGPYSHDPGPPCVVSSPGQQSLPKCLGPPIAPTPQRRGDWAGPTVAPAPALHRSCSDITTMPLAGRNNGWQRPVISTWHSAIRQPEAETSHSPPPARRVGRRWSLKGGLPRLGAMPGSCTSKTRGRQTDQHDRRTAARAKRAGRPGAGWVIPAARPLARRERRWPPWPRGLGGAPPGAAPPPPQGRVSAAAGWRRGRKKRSSGVWRHSIGAWYLFERLPPSPRKREEMEEVEEVAEKR